MTTVLTSRQTALQTLLWRIVNRPGSNKAEIVGNVPSKTRANHYQGIDRLISLGLVEDRGGRGIACSLYATPAGVEEDEQW